MPDKRKKIFLSLFRRSHVNRCLWNHKINHLARIAMSTSIIIVLVSTIAFPTAAIIEKHSAAGALDFIARVNELVFVPGDELVVFGKTNPNDLLVVRIFDPNQRAIKIDDVPTDEGGFFRETVFKWPEPERNIPFGTYTIEITSGSISRNSQQIEVTFAEAIRQGLEETPTTSIPITHALNVKLDSPTEVSIGKPFRIFIQVTFDGALVDSDDAKTTLGTSHIHSGNSTQNIPNFQKLHEGLYYADVTIQKEGAYIIHAVAFHRGYLAHDSRVVTASSSSIGSIQETVNQLADRLNTANQELDKVQETLDQTRTTLNASQIAITNSVDEARSSIADDLQAAKDASGQVNSLILPVLALISVIIALQISLFARIRASYR